MRKRAINFSGSVDKRDEFDSLDTMLQVVFFYASWYAWTRYGKLLLITSIDRDDGVHADHRGLDVDVCNRFVYQGGILPSDAQEITGVVNMTFVYDPHRMGMRIAIYGGNDPKGKHWGHIHFQVCWGERSRCL